jgi:hypothetical protein
MGEVYIDESDPSETLVRPHMNRLLAAIDAGVVKRLIVYSIDRLPRRLPLFAVSLPVLYYQATSIARRRSLVPRSRVERKRGSIREKPQGLNRESL